MSDPPLRIWLAIDPGDGPSTALRAYDRIPWWADQRAAAGWTIVGPYVLEAETTARHLPIVGEVY